jgi:hypothetical protein
MRFLILLSAALLTACASAPDERPAASSTPVAAATVAEATTTAPAATAGSVATAGQPADDIGEPAVAKAKPGYSLTTKNGQPVYCRREIPTGSRRPVTNCYTPEQLEEIERATKETQDAMGRQRNSSGCGNFCSAGS